MNVCGLERAISKLLVSIESDGWCHLLANLFTNYMLGHIHGRGCVIDSGDVEDMEGV